MRPVGNQRSFVEKSMIIRRPNQNVGMAYSTIPKFVVTTS